jgi:bifunctional ADP-heptose synthase (sugar kinase/adenylyltransferase)
MIGDLIHLLLLLNNMVICTQAPSPGARVVYIDGAFDLFHAGHVEVLFYLFSCKSLNLVSTSLFTCLAFM